MGEGGREGRALCVCEDSTTFLGSQRPARTQHVPWRKKRRKKARDSPWTLQPHPTLSVLPPSVTVDQPNLISGLQPRESATKLVRSEGANTQDRWAQSSFLLFLSLPRPRSVFTNPSPNTSKYSVWLWRLAVNASKFLVWLWQLAVQFWQTIIKCQLLLKWRAGRYGTRFQHPPPPLPPSNTRSVCDEWQYNTAVCSYESRFLLKYQ